MLLFSKYAGALFSDCGHAGVPEEDWSLYEFDHWYPLSIGGCNDERNLWPQVASSSQCSSVLSIRALQPIDEAHQKDALENQLYHVIVQGCVFALYPTVCSRCPLPINNFSATVRTLRSSIFLGAFERNYGSSRGGSEGQGVASSCRFLSGQKFDD